MASGCDKINDSNKCLDPISDNCVIYTGPAFPELGVCTGDTVSEDLVIILTKLQELLNEGEIEVGNVTLNCDFTKKYLAGKDKKLSTYIQALLDQNCEINDKIKASESATDQPLKHNFNFRCLPTPPPQTENQLLQTLIDSLCKLQTDLDQLTSIGEDPEDEEEQTPITTLVENTVIDILTNKLKSCSKSIVKRGTGSNSEFHFINGCPNGTLLFGNYPLNAFDSTGKGIESAGFCGWFLADGRNGTWDMRGQTASGATEVSPNRALLPNVSIVGDSDTRTTIGSIKGVPKIKINLENLPEHQHRMTTGDHTHTVTIPRMGVSRASYGPLLPGGRDVLVPMGNLRDHVTTSPSFSDVSTSKVEYGVRTPTFTESVPNDPIENRPPTRYGVWIQRVSAPLHIYQGPEVDGGFVTIQ